jgi:hypothetical protein
MSPRHLPLPVSKPRPDYKRTEGSIKRNAFSGLQLCDMNTIFICWSPALTSPPGNIIELMNCEGDCKSPRHCIAYYLAGAASYGRVTTKKDTAGFGRRNINSQEIPRGRRPSISPKEGDFFLTQVLTKARTMEKLQISKTRH